MVPQPALWLTSHGITIRWMISRVQGYQYVGQILGLYRLFGLKGDMFPLDGCNFLWHFGDGP
jgi:hypothetical protein